MNGDRCEREVRDWFFTVGGAAVRTGSSGSRIAKPMPDVLGGKNGVMFSLEVKSTNDNYAAFKEHDLIENLKFAYRMGAIPCFDARFSHDTTHYVLTGNQVMDLYDRENSGSFSLKKDRREEYMTLGELVAMYAQETPSMIQETFPRGIDVEAALNDYE